MLKQFPNSLTLYNIQGAASAGLDQFDAAIASYKQALKIKPDLTEANNNMGNAPKDKGELDASIESYKNAILGFLSVKGHRWLARPMHNR